jgi:hypothetical protein
MKKFFVLFVFVITLIVGFNTKAEALVYEGALTSGIPVTGSVSGGGWINGDAVNTDFWKFYGTAGDFVNITGLRLDGGLDTALSLYLGTKEDGAEASFSPQSSFDGLTFLGYGDDNLPPNVPGPFGDPFLSYNLPSTNWYTVAIGGYASSGSGPYRYNLTMTGASGNVIPEPASLSLLGLGLLGLLRKRKINFNANGRELHANDRELFA